MAKKAKSLNPADAFRKSQRQKEIKRNKLERKKAREGAQNRKDPKVLQTEIKQLEILPKPTQSEQKRLEDLKAELAQVLKSKGDKALGGAIVKFGETGGSGSSVIIDPATGKTKDNVSTSQPQTGNHLPRKDSKTMDWFGPDGKLLEPEKSFYYDPVFNPFGVPPPGMPMRMKAIVEKAIQPSNSEEAVAEDDIGGSSDLDSEQDLNENEEEGDAEDDKEEEEQDQENDEDDIDIPMPDGSPPESAGSEEDSDDDIPLPEGPPPSKPTAQSGSKPLIDRPAKALPDHFNQKLPPIHLGSLHPPPFFPPPITLAPGGPPPPLVAGLGMMPLPLLNGFPLPPPPTSSFHPLPFAPPSANLPPKPNATVPSGNLPDAGGSPSLTKSTSTQSSATMTALPQLRDLKREATSFVPTAIRKKRKEQDRRAELAGLAKGIQAAPGSGKDDDNLALNVNSEPKQLTTSLLGALKRDGIVTDDPHHQHKGYLSSSQRPSSSPQKDDYDKFVESLGDVL